MAAKYDLGTAEGKVKITYDGKGVDQAKKGFSEVGASGEKAGRGLDSVGSKAGIAGLAVAAGIGLAVNSAVSFEKQISAIGAVSGASGKELDAFRKKALQLGADTQFSASEAAQAMEELSKAGISTTDILNGAADATVALAAAGGVDLPTAATLAANAMNSFGVTAKELPAIVDKIAGAANASAIDVGEFGFSLAQVGAVAHLAGISFGDTATAIAELGNAGIKGSDAGTSLKTFLQNLIPTTKQQIELFKQLGLITKNGSNQFFDASGKVKSFAEVQQVLQNAMRGTTKEQQLQYLQTLFGSDAIRAAAVFADQGAAGFNTLNAAIDKTKAADVAAARMDNAAGRLEALKGSAETLAITFGELLLPMMDRLTKMLTRLANWLTGLSGAWKKTIVIVLASIGGLLLIVSVVSKIIAIIRVFQTAWLLLNATFIATPIGLIIVAIIALVAVFVILWLKCDAFRNFFIRIWGYIWSFMKTIGKWFAGPFADFFVDLWHKMQKIWEAVWKVIKLYIDFVIGYFKFWWKVISAIIDFFGPAIKGMFDFIIAAAQTWWAIFSAFWAVIFAILRAIFEPVIKGIVVVWEWAFGIITNAAKVWWAAFSAFWQFIWKFLGPFLKLIVDGIVDTWKWGFNIVAEAAKIWWNVFSAFWNGVWNLVKWVWGQLVEAVRLGVSAIGKIFEFFASLLRKVRDWFNGLKDAAGGGIWNLVKYIAEVPGKIMSALGDVGSMLYDSGRKIIQGLINGIGSMIGKVKDEVGKVLGAARNLLPHSPAKEGPFSGRGWTTYSGAAIMDGLAQGIESRARSAVLAMTTALRNVNQAGYAAPTALAGAAGAGVGATVPAPPVYVSLNVDGKEIGRAAVLDPAATARSVQRGQQMRAWQATPSRVGI
jgi:TP901 family phage tail tape measure protein